MRHLKRQWKTVGVVFVLTVTGGALWWGGGGSVVATAEGGGEGEYDPVSGTLRAAIVQVLEELDLDRAALAALNVNATQAEQLVADVRAWVEDNRATLAAADQEIAARVPAVRTLEQAMRTGPAEDGHEAALAAARRALSAARGDRRTALDAVQTLVAQRLSVSQRDNWAAIQSGYGSRMPIRMLALTGTQRHDYGQARRWFRLQLAGAQTEQERETAQAAWEEARGDILTDENLEMIATWEQYVSDSSEAVAEAFDTVLPPADRDT